MLFVWKVVKSHWGVWLVSLLSTLLILLAIRWMGYDYHNFASVEIGNRYDARFNSWSLYQAIDNLLHRPLNLGYAPIFYGDSNSFSDTIAPYGIAIVTLPVYILSGANLPLTYNLYLIATFVFTGLIAYWLLRYLLQCTPGVGVLSGLLVAFAQFRFLQFSHIETLSMQFYLVNIYCLHRLLNDPQPKWALGLAASFWLNFLTSGYLSIMAVVTGLIILLGALIRKPAIFNKQLIALLGASGLLLCVCLLPFISVRFGNEQFSKGFPIDALQAYSATPADWFSGISKAYSGISPYHDERMLFLGFIPMGLAVVGWLTRKSAWKQPTETKSFSLHTILILYTIITLTGYILTLGPELKLSEQTTILMPYAILYQLPGFFNIRVVARFIVLPILGTTVLGMYALSYLRRVMDPLAYRVLVALIVAGLMIELVPDNGNSSSRIIDGLSQPGTLIQPLQSAANTEVYRWLASQPAGTPVIHYPGGLQTVDQYIYDQKQYQQPLLNGWGSYIPPWYSDYANNFPDAQGVQQLQMRQAKYLLVHNEAMNAAEQSAFKAHIAPFLLQNGGPFTLIQRLDLVDIYRLDRPVIRELRISGPDSLYSGFATGWSKNWSIAKDATINVVLSSEPAGYRVQFSTFFITADIQKSFVFSVNDQPIPTTSAPQSDYSTLYTGLIPRALIELDPSGTILTFHVSDLISPKALGASDDIRELGVGLGSLDIRPYIDL